MRSNLLIIDLNNCVYGILFRKTFPFPVCTTLYPTFIESGFKLRSLTKFDLKFLQCDKYDCICILLYTDIQVDQYHLLKVLPFSGLYIKKMCFSVIFIQNIRYPYMCVLITMSEVPRLCLC